MKVMIVDDSRMIALTVSGMLTEKDFEVVTAQDGLEAKTMLEKGEIVDFILLDWNMPNMDGLAFLEANLVASFTQAKIIMMTTENKDEKMRTALGKGAVEYITKPFTPEILYSKISMVRDML